MTPQFLRQAPERLVTPRLLLEKIHPAHAEQLRASVLRSREELEFVQWARGPWDHSQAVYFCRHTRHAMEHDGALLTYLVFDTRGSEQAATPTRTLRQRSRPPASYVGLLDLHSFDFSVPRCQIGYVGDSAVRGMGLMREAALSLIAQAHRWGVQRIEAWCDARNERSIRFSESLGLRREGLLRQASRDPRGLLCDQIVLARLAHEPIPSMDCHWWPDTVPTIPPGLSL